MRCVASVLVAVAIGVLSGCGAHAHTAQELRLARRVFLEDMATGRLEHPEEIYAADFVSHAAWFDYTLAQDQAATRSWREAMPDLKVSVTRTVAERDLVALQWHAAGTNTVAAGGMPGKGARVAIDGMTFFRFVRGRIAEEWSIVDVVTLGQQLNATSAPRPGH